MSMIGCHISATVRHSNLPDRDIQRTVAAVLAGEGYADWEAGVHIVGEAQMRSINRKSRGVDRSTDVLSFSLLEGGDTVPGVRNRDIGDIFLCMPYINRQARRFGVSAREEGVRMLIHGMLHAIGYDHRMPKEAQKMFARQEYFVHLLV